MLHKITPRNFNEDGFTLVEIVIVVVILGILAAIAIPIFLNQQNSAFDATIKSDIKNTLTSLEATYTKNQNQNYNGWHMTVSDKKKIESLNKKNYLLCLGSEIVGGKVISTRYAMLVASPAGRVLMGTKTVPQTEYTGPWGTDGDAICSSVLSLPAAAVISTWGWGNPGWDYVTEPQPL